ncbi:D-arabinono-1,4-lactone oxidase [Salinibacterium sp. ZJ77]|uniref:D-arabinono-1,4-lactone oxidase n=1 Tax=Salinibacterium sp. ZJ77 TaxID=2708337 RepID=UPI00141EC374|nr:D-arabinono-1,4-lactone oxidase [Salinibacterium sp. ZJ77]
MLNWAGNVRFGAAGSVTVPTVADLQHRIATRTQGVRPIGTAHSFSTVADGPPTSTFLRLLSSAENELRVATDRRSVRIPAARTYGEIAPLLEAEGLALANLASLPHISVGGSVSTGSHGSGASLGSLATAVRAIELVNGRGELVTLRRGDPDFAGAVVSLGALGVFTHLELDVEPTFDIAQRVYLSLPLDGVLENFTEVTSLGYSVSLFTTWSDADIVDQLWLKRRVDRDPEPPADVLGALPARVPMHPIGEGDTAACTPQLDEPGPWHTRLPHFRLEHTPSLGVEIQSEYLVPLAQAEEALREVRSLAHVIAPHLLVCEIRRIAPDDLWLSGAYGTDAVGIHFTWRRRPAQLAKLLPMLEERLLPRGARPHWGKQFVADRAQLAALYPRFDDFRALAERFDPYRLFRNDFLAEKVGLPGR